MAMTACAANVRTSSICFSLNGRTCERVRTITPMAMLSRKSGTPRMVRNPAFCARSRMVLLGIPYDIGHMDGFAFQKRAAGHTSSTALMPNISDEFVQLRRIIVDGSEVIRPLVLSRDARHIRVTEPRRGFGYLVKHALKVKACATYELKNVGSGGLLFERLVPLAGEPREFAFLIAS